MDDFNARDLFAGLAVAGWLGNGKLKTSTPYPHIAKEAYDMAEAMLKEKEKRDGGESKVSN